MNGTERDAFVELLSFLEEEDLIRLVRRSQMSDNYWLADILEDELELRSLHAKKEDKPC